MAAAAVRAPEADCGLLKACEAPPSVAALEESQTGLKAPCRSAPSARWPPPIGSFVMQEPKTLDKVAYVPPVTWHFRDIGEFMSERRIC